MAKLIDLECLKAYNENIKKIFGEQIDLIKTQLKLFYFKEYDLTVFGEPGIGQPGLSGYNFNYDNILHLYRAAAGWIRIQVPKQSSYRVLVSAQNVVEPTTLTVGKQTYIIDKDNTVCTFDVNDVEVVEFRIDKTLWLDEIDIAEIQTIPTKVSQLENDSLFVNSTVDKEILLLNIG